MENRVPFLARCTLLGAFGVFAACGGPEIEQSDHFRIEPLGEGVYAAIHRPGGSATCNAGIVDLGDETLVFDPFLTPEAAGDLKRVAEDLTGNPVRMVVNSHHHNDHIRGNQVFDEGTRIFATPWTIDAISQIEPETIAWEMENAPAQLAEAEATLAAAPDSATREEADMWVGYYRGMLESHSELRTVLPNVAVDSVVSIFGEDREVRLIPMGEAHTGSDLVMYLPDDGVAFMGDILFVEMHPFLADGSPERWLDVLDEARRLGATVFVPGHGEVVGEEGLGTMVSYLQTIEAIVEEALEQGRSVDEVLGDGVPEAFGTWHFPLFYEVSLRFLFGRVSS